MESRLDAAANSSTLIVGTTTGSGSNVVVAKTATTTAAGTATKGSRTKSKVKATAAAKNRQQQQQQSEPRTATTAAESVTLTPSSSVEAAEGDNLDGGKGSSCLARCSGATNELRIAETTSTPMTIPPNSNTHNNNNNNNNNNNDNTLCASRNMDGAGAVVDRTSGDLNSLDASIVTEEKLQMSANSHGDEHPTKLLPNGSESAVSTPREVENEEDNWESLIDSGTLDKSLEQLRMKDRGVARLNDANKDTQRDQLKKEKTKTPSGPGKIHVRLEEPSRTTTTPTIKILRRETTPAGGVSAASGQANGERGSSTGDNFPHGRGGEISRSTGQSSAVPTPPAGKSFAQRQEEYARARMRILGPGNGNGNSPLLPSAPPSTTSTSSSSSAPASSQQRNHNSSQAIQRPMPGNVGRGFGPDTTGGGRRGSYITGPHRRGGGSGHNSATSSALYYGNSSSLQQQQQQQQQQQHHQNNNPYSNSGYYNGNRHSSAVIHATGGQHVNTSSSHSNGGGGGLQGVGSPQQQQQHTPPTMHRTNGGYMR